MSIEPRSLFLTFDFFLLTFSHKILAIECTHQCISVAFGAHGNVVEETVREWQRTAESIVPLIDRVLALAGAAIEDVQLLAISSGPGSFTALRIGMATAKGVAYGTGIPLVTVSTMEALADSASHHSRASCLVPVIPARKGEFYYTIYVHKGNGLEEMDRTSYAKEERLKEILATCGDRCTVVAREIASLEEVCRTAGVDALRADFFTAASLIPLAEKKYAAGEVGSLETLTPDYQQKFRPAR